MTKLEESRAKIDAIDAQLTQLFEQRFEEVKKVIEYKLEHHMPILNESREEIIIHKNESLIQDDDIRPYFLLWYKEMLALSKEYQQEIRDSQ